MDAIAIDEELVQRSSTCRGRVFTLSDRFSRLSTTVVVSLSFPFTLPASASVSVCHSRNMEQSVNEPFQKMVRYGRGSRSGQIQQTRTEEKSGPGTDRGVYSWWLFPFGLEEKDAKGRKQRAEMSA